MSKTTRDYNYSNPLSAGGYYERTEHDDGSVTEGTYTASGQPVAVVETDDKGHVTRELHHNILSI